VLATRREQGAFRDYRIWLTELRGSLQRGQLPDRLFEDLAEIRTRASGASGPAADIELGLDVFTGMPSVKVTAMGKRLFGFVKQRLPGGAVPKVDVPGR
jgi:hypothetical protein